VVPNPPAVGAAGVAEAGANGFAAGVVVDPAAGVVPNAFVVLPPKRFEAPVGVVVEPNPKGFAVQRRHFSHLCNNINSWTRQIESI
jgi:hypothetical protein